MARLGLIALLLCACYPVQVPTPAVIAQLRGTPGGARFQGCTVNLAWTEQDLLDNCGEPDGGYVEWVNHPGSRCALYTTIARSFAAGMGADAVLVCMTKAERRYPTEVRVWAVFGVNSSALPTAGLGR